MPHTKETEEPNSTAASVSCALSGGTVQIECVDYLHWQGMWWHIGHLPPSFIIMMPVTILHTAHMPEHFPEHIREEGEESDRDCTLNPYEKSITRRFDNLFWQLAAGKGI